MNVIIDGYNLMHKLNIKGSSLEKKREALLDIITEFCEMNENKGVVVFDAHGTESNMHSAEKRKRLKIVYTAGGETADDRIIEMLGKKDPKNFAVVSSDNYIRDFAVSKKFTIIKSEEFAQYLV